MKDKYQTLTLTLSDGRKVTYTGKAQIDPLEQVRVVEVIISEPKELPGGMIWDVMEGSK